MPKRYRYASFLKKCELKATPFEIYQSFGGRTPRVLLESARVSPATGRYSIVASDPFLVFKSKGREGEPLKTLQKLLKRFACASESEFPPFIGGAIGYFAYEVKNLIEPHLPQNASDDIGLPDIYLLFFDQGILVDHEKNTSWFFTLAPIQKTLQSTKKLAERRLDALELKIKKGLRSRLNPHKGATSLLPSVNFSMTREDFLKAVEEIKQAIEQGEIFQANLSQRFSFETKEKAAVLYQRLKKVNPSSFFGILDVGDFQIISGSPERLVKLENGILETRPIAGTRSRGKTAQEDKALALELLLNEKECAEHIMLVDLERNDMGRVSELGSVSVDELMTLEDYSHVKHIVSNIRGVLKKGLDCVDVLKAFFPGGTITGAPKIRCMEILDAIEPMARGIYTGSLGYLSFTGNMDLNIMIRSLIIKGQRAHLQVGAGIVADSIPEKEYDETLYKAEAVFSALFGETQTNAFFAKCRTADSVS